jgi:hypothetical protein
MLIFTNCNHHFCVLLCIAVTQEVALAGVDGLAMLVQLVGATGLSNIQVTVMYTSYTIH